MFERIKDIIFKIKDYDRLAHDYSEVLCYITDNRLSKTTYKVESLMTTIDDILTERDEQTYKDAEKDILSLIEQRLSELLGDAQPTPILRYELRDLIKKIKEE